MFSWAFVFCSLDKHEQRISFMVEVTNPNHTPANQDFENTITWTCVVYSAALDELLLSWWRSLDLCIYFLQSWRNHEHVRESGDSTIVENCTFMVASSLVIPAFFGVARISEYTSRYAERSLKDWGRGCVYGERNQIKARRTKVLLHGIITCKQVVVTLWWVHHCLHYIHTRPLCPL